MIVIAFVYGLLIFWVPILAELKSDMGTKLNAMERFVLNISELAMRFGFVLVPFILILLAGTIAWRIYCSVSKRRVANE